MNRQRIEGGLKKTTGTIKQQAGKAIRDHHLETEGKVEKTEGHIRSGIEGDGRGARCRQRREVTGPHNQPWASPKNKTKGNVARAQATLPSALHHTFDALVHDYAVSTKIHTGEIAVQYKVLADLVRAGWRRVE